MPLNPGLDSRNFHRWAVFGVISSVYFLVYFHRVSTSVIAPDLLDAFQTHATALGFMSSMYFYVYALEQPLVGYLTDRLGPRRVVVYWSFAATLGCVLFSMAPTIGWAAVGRALIGFGVGGVYVPAMKAFSQWFRKNDFAFMTGLLLAAGNLGAIVATTPLAWMARTWGWRLTFLVIGGVTFGLALATQFGIRDYPETGNPVPGRSSRSAGQAPPTRGPVRQVHSALRFWILAAMFFGFFGTFLTFQGLWATPFLMSMFNLSQLPASELNMLLPVGFMLGAPLFGRLTDRIFKNRIHLLITILLIQTVIWVMLTFGGRILGPAGMIPLLFVMGTLAGGFATALWALLRDVTPSRIMGITTGLLNPAPFLGVAVLQVVTGAILDRVGRVGQTYPPDAFQKAFLLCVGVMVGCLLLCTWLRKYLYGGPGDSPSQGE
jgi:sugar phosphate permease